MDKILSKRGFVTFIHQAEENIGSDGTMKLLIAHAKFFCNTWLHIPFYFARQTTTVSSENWANTCVKKSIMLCFTSNLACTLCF